MIESTPLQVIRTDERPTVDFAGGALYRPIIGDDTGAGIPVRTGYQYSPPGYSTPAHSHPYTEIITVISGRGEAWCPGALGVVAMEPGVTLAIPPGKVHAFRAIGTETLVTFGIHAHGKRVVEVHSTTDGA